MTEPVISRRARRQAAGGEQNPPATPAASPTDRPAWAAGRVAAGGVAPEPRLAQLYPGSRPIPVVHTPSTGLSGWGPGRAARPPSRLPGGNLPGSSLPGGERPNESGSPSAQSRPTPGPRTAGPGITGLNSASLNSTARPASGPGSGALRAMMTGATVRADHGGFAASRPAAEGLTRGTLPGSVLSGSPSTNNAPVWRSGPAAAFSAYPSGRRPGDLADPQAPAPASWQSPASSGADNAPSSASFAGTGSPSPASFDAARSPSPASFSGASPQYPVSFSGASAPSSASFGGASAPSSASFGGASAPSSASFGGASSQTPDRSPVYPAQPPSTRMPASYAAAQAATRLAEPDWESVKAPTPQPQPPSRPIAVVPPQPKRVGEASAAAAAAPFADTKPPVYATGSMRAIEVPLAPSVRPAPPHAKPQPSVPSDQPVALFDPFGGCPDQLASPPLEPASPAAWSENSALLPSATQQAAEANQAAWPEDQSNTPLPWADDSANQPLHWSDSPGSDYLEQPADDWSAQAAAPANTGLTDTGSIRVWAASVDSFAAEQPANWTEPAQPASAPIVEPSSDSQLFDTFADNPDLTGQSFDQPAPADWQAPAIANNFDSDWSQLGPAVVADDQAESGFDQTNAAQNWDAEPLWDPPPEILQDGTGPWLAGPDAQQEVPRRRVGRLIVSLVLILLLAVAIGFAVWFVINQTRPAADAATLFNLPQTVTSVGFQVVR